MVKQRGRPAGQETSTGYIHEAEYVKLQDPDLIPLKFRLMYRILFNSALRIGELLKSKVEHLIKDLNEETGENQHFIYLPDQKNQEKDEWVPIKPEDYSSLKDYINLLKKQPGDYIFTGQRGKHSSSYVNEKFKEHCELVGITRHLTTHSNRRGFVTRMKKKGYLYEEIADVTRHKNIAVMRKHYDKQIKTRAYNIVVGKEKIRPNAD